MLSLPIAEIALGFGDSCISFVNPNSDMGKLANPVSVVAAIRARMVVFFDAEDKSGAIRKLLLYAGETKSWAGHKLTMPQMH